MSDEHRVLTNTDIVEISMAAPEGHRHLRTTLTLASGESIVLQEATVANLVRAYVTLKTHPQKQAVRLRGRELDDADKKPGFAAWQLLEED